MANLMNLQELEKYISNDEVLSQVYSGDYLSKLAAKRFGKEGKQTSEAAIAMAQRGAARQNVKSTFSKIETEAKNLGLEVRYDVNKSKNEITVVFVDKKGVVASEKVGLGTADRTLKNNMAAQKMFGGHISDRGATLLTQTEEVALSFLETLKKTSQLKTSKVDKRDFLKTQLKVGKKEAEKSVVTSETYSFIEDDEFDVGNMPSSSKERDIMQGGIIKVGGIIGEVSKGVDFLSELRKKNKISKKQAEAKNQRVDQYMTEYVATYQMLGEKIAEERFIASMMNEGLDLSEKTLRDKIAEMKRQFGEFLQMKPSIGLSKDEAFKNKKFVYGGVSTAAFRTFLTTGRHLGQTEHYLEKSAKGKRQSAKRLDEIFIASDSEEMKDTEHKLYSRALVSDEEAVLSALKTSIEAEILERQEKFKGSKRYKKMSKQERADELKKIDAEVRAQIPEVNAAILEDMGLTKESVMREQESWRDVTGTITEKEYQKYKDIAIEKLSKQAEKEYKKLSDEKKATQTQEDFTNKYISSHKTDLDRIIAEKATGRKGLSIANIEQWETEGGEIGYDIKAKEIIGGNVGKLLWLRTGLRETARGINDRIFQRMTKILGVEGADVIGLTKKIKAEEIPGYAQAILTQQIVNASNEKKAEILAKLGSLGFNIIEKNGKYYVDNSMEQVEKQDWDGLVDYLTDDFKVFEKEIDKDSGKATYKFAMNAANIRALQFMDVANRADVWEPTKDVKLGYKEASAALREVSAAGLSGEQKESLVKDLKIIYDPTKGRTGGVAQKAQKDIDAILNKETGAIVRTYESKTKQSRAVDVAALRSQSYSRGSTIDNKDQTYVITIGNGSGYSIDVNDLLKNKAVWDKSGGLTEEEYRKTIWGVIDAAKQELVKQGVSPENIQVAIDPGTDFGFEMFNEDGKGGGAVGRFIYLPNIETDVRYDGDEALYELPEYSQDVNSLIGSMKRSVAKSTVKPKAQAVVQKIFATAQSEKSSLGEKAFKKRFGASKAGKVTEISRSKINELIARGDEEAANRLMSAVYVSRAAGLNMLRDRDKYTSVQDGKEVYNREEHGAFLTAALKYLKGDDIVKTIYGSEEALSEEAAKERFAILSDEEKDQLIQKLVGEVATAITDTSFSGKVKGLSGIVNRFPSLQKHAALFGEMLISENLEAAEIRMGPAMTKVLNGDYDGDTVNFILGLWSSGMSFDAAAKLAERQKRINRRFYDKMLKSTTGSDDAIFGGDISRLKDTESMGLSALATKFNKPFTGIFSNMSTRIREGLKALGRDYIDEQGNVKDLSTQDDYVDAIRTELVTAVGQILEQDSISSKKVDERISKLRELKGGAITEEDKKQIELNTLNEFKDLENMIRDENSTYEDIINKLGEMGLVGGDATQITGVVTSVIEELIDNLDDDTRNKILKKVGISEDELSSGKISKNTFLKAGKDLESNLFDESGKWYKIFSGTFGSGLATSRTFTPFMKGDPYQLFKFLKETNNLLRETGEIIDENGKKFTEYGESINKTHNALSGEAAQEQAKVVIAGKEGKAIERNANMYQQLSEKLEAAGNNYKAIDRLSTSELKSRLLPYGGEQTTGIDEKTLNRVYRQIKGGKAFSKEELAALFGVENEKALNSLFMGNLSTVRGNYVHNLAQGDTKGARKERAKLDKMFRVLGYSDEEIAKTFDIYKTGAKNVKSITKQYGASLGSEIPFIGMTSDGQYVINARGDEFFVGERANPFYKKGSDQKKTQKVFTAVDYKTHTSGKLEDADIVQGVIYKTFLEDLQSRLKNMSGDIDIDALRAEINKGMKYTTDTKEREALLAKITPNLIKELKESDVIQTEIVVVNPSTGSAQAYSVGADKDKFKVVRDIILSGDTSPLTAEGKASVKGVAKKRTDARYFKPGETVDKTGSIEDKMKQTRGATSNIEGQQEFNKLLDQEYDIRKKIQALQHEIDREQAKKGYTGDLEKDKEYLEEILEGIKIEQAALLNSGVDERAEKRKAKERELSYSEQLLSKQDSVKTMSEYEDFLDKTTRADQELVGIRAKTLTTTGTEKELYEKIYALKYNALQADKEQLKTLEELANKVDPNRVESLKEQAEINAELYRAQAMKQTRGATSLWDVMANDIRRATMRVADFSIAVKIFNKIPQDIQKVIQYAKQLDTALVNLRIASGLNKEEGEALILTYNKLAKSLSATTQEVADAGDAWLRQGYTVESTTKLIEASLKLSKLGQIQSSEATKALTAALKGFKLEASEAMDVVDKLTKVDMAAAVSAGDIAEGLSRVSTSAQLAGLDMDKTIGILSTIGEVTQRDLGSVGDSLKTLLSRYGNVKAGVFTQMGLDDDGETTENINDIEKVLRQLGISIRTTSLEMRSVDEVLDELASKWSTLDTVTKNAIATAFAGVRQRENFLVLMENWERANELAEESADSAGTAAEKYKIYEDSVEAATKKLEAAWENLSREFKASDIVKGGTKFLTFFVENLGLITRMIVALIATVNSSKISDFMANTAMKAGTGIKGLFAGGLFKGGIFGTGGRVLTYDEQGNPVFGKQSENTGWNKAATKIVGAITGVNGVIKPIEEIRDAVMGKSSASGTKKGIATLGEKDISLFSKKELEKMSAEEKQQASAQQVYKHGFTGVTGEKIDGERIYYKGGYAYTSKGRVMADRTIEPFMTQAPSNIIRDPESGKLRYVDQSGNVVTNKLGIPKAVSKLDKEAFQTYESDMALSQEAAQASKAYGTMAAFAKIQQVSMAGISAYVGQQLSNRDVGTGLAADWYNKTGQTVEETDADKQGRVWGTTATTMIGTALLGEAGSAIGQVVGEELFGYFNYLAHEEELVQKQESAEAAENLEALNKIESHTKSIENRVKTSMLSSEDYQELLNYMDAVRQNVSSMSSSQMAKYLEDLGEAIGASGSDYTTVMNKLQSNLLDGDKATRENTLQQMKVVTAQQELEETIDSQKSKRKEITGSDTVEIDAPTWMKITNYATQIGAQAAIAGGLGAAGGSAFGPLGTVAGLGAGLASGTISGIATAAGMNAALDELYHDYVFTGTPEERLRQAKEQREKVAADDDATENYRKRVLEKLDEYIATQTQQVVELANMDKEIIQKRVNVGLTAANLAQYTDDELSGLTLEGAINKVADAMENQGIKVRDVAGIIKDEYLPSIKAAIQSDTALSALTKGDTKTIGELFEAPTKLSELLAKANISQTYEGLRKLLDESTPQNKGIFNSIAAALGYSADNLTALVYAADPERIEQFGNAWNLPIDKVQELKDKFDTLTAAEGLMSPSEVREKYGKYSDILEKISGTTSYDRETYEGILSNYPELYQYLREGQGSLYGALANMIGEQQQFAYGHALFTEELDNKEIAADFKKRMQEGDFKDIFGDLELDTAIFGDADSIQKILTQAALLGGEIGQKIQDAVKKYMNWDRIIKIDDPQLTQAIEAQKQKLDEQLDNLKEQKEALDDINNQRKYEIELIKAKAQLEDARKDKKRVYREGVGFVYQADEDAVAKAQEKIDELNVDMQKEELQVQIDQLTVEKSILDNLEKSEQLAQLQEGLDQWQEKQTDAMGGLTALLAQAYQKQGVEFNFGEGDWIQDWINNVLEQRTKKLEKAEAARTKYESALAEVQQAEASGRTSKEFQQKAALFQVAAKAYQEARDAVGDPTEEERKKYGLDTIRQKDINEATEKYKPSDAIALDKNKYSVEGLSSNARENDDVDITVTIDGEKKTYDLSSGKITSDAIATDLTAAYKGKYNKEPEAGSLVYLGGLVYMYDKKGNWRLPKNDMDDADVMFSEVGSETQREGYASGTLSANSGLSLINELGTEGIITPSGTLTALPSKTGVVPADITRNVWQLGEVAPTLIAQLGSLVRQKAFVGAPQSVVNEEGQYIDHLTMNVYPTKDYDMDALLAEARTKVKLTKHNN